MGNIGGYPCPSPAQVPFSMCSIGGIGASSAFYHAQSPAPGGAFMGTFPQMHVAGVGMGPPMGGFTGAPMSSFMGHPTAGFASSGTLASPAFLMGDHSARTGVVAGAGGLKACQCVLNVEAPRVRGRATQVTAAAATTVAIRMGGPRRREKGTRKREKKREGQQGQGPEKEEKARAVAWAK